MYTDLLLLETTAENPARTQLWVVAAALIQQSSSLFWAARHSAVEQVLDLRPAFRSHAAPG